MKKKRAGERPEVDHQQNADAVVHEKLNDALTLELGIECDPEEAERLGAFVEDAISDCDVAGCEGEDVEVLDGRG